jgi:membrane associated rhomboid family serine protease
VATLSVLFFTVALTLLQIAFPEVRLALWRDEAGLESGEVWRLVSPLLIQYDPPVDAVMVLVLIGVVGTAVERVFGPARWLAIYLACGVLGQAFGYFWDPADAGCSVAGRGCLAPSAHGSSRRRPTRRRRRALRAWVWRSAVLR